MTTYKTITEPIGFDANLHKLDLFFPYNILAMKDGKQYDFSVEVRDIAGRPDCKVGDWCNNIWFRPKAALSKDWEGYSGYSILSRAVKNMLKKRGFEVLGWYKRES